MYAEISYDGTVAVNDVLTTIVNVLTGTTDVTTFSVGLVSGSTVTDVYRPAGWELWDDISASEKVIRAPYTDVAGEYKYIKFTAVDAASDYIYWEMYRDWDNGSHTGTLNRRIANTSVVSASSYARVFYRQSNTTGTIYLSSSSKHFACVCSTDSNTRYTNMGLLSERSRINDWDLNSSPYKPVVQTNYGFSGDYMLGSNSVQGRYPFSIETVPVPNNGGVYDVNTSTGDNVSWQFNTSIGMSASYNSSGYYGFCDGIAIPTHVLDSSYQQRRPVVGFGTCSNPSSGFYGGDISNEAGMYLTNDAGTIGETFTSNGFDYKVWQFSSSNTNTASSPIGTGEYRILVLKG